MAELVSHTKIWDQAPHNAFTDLIRFGDGWLCTFRESEEHGHVPASIRVLRSTDGDTWESAGEIVDPGVDLRDPKLSIMPDGRVLLMTCANFTYDDGTYRTRSPRVAFSADGSNWSELTKVLSEDHWLWRVTWHDGVGYSVSKLGIGNNPRRGFLYRTTDALQWDFVSEFILPDDIWTASETTVRILPDDRMVALIRPDWIGVAEPPYHDWSFTRIDASLGGPNFIQVPDGSLWASARGRDENGEPRTLLARMTTDSWTPELFLPSGGDCSYPGMVWHEDLLWMTHYSSHEGRSSIYLAKIDLG